ncbi:IPT/TIG domain-containing protein [endosymbiont of Lamellibrachia barhami]|uniref:IPT/TIG domain-containing protein n=1 Tax=endosymbiont of Lamellibrachia barhami TaxID=205975 RepID=UPI0015AAE45E
MFLVYLVSITLVFPAWIFSSIAPREAFASTPPDPAEYTVNSVPGYFVDISTTGTRVLPQLVDEDAKGAVPIGFDIEYFGRPFNSVTITSNGYLTFGIDIEPGNTPLPSTAGPDSLIAVFWDDLDPSLNPSADIYYETQGAAPDRRFIVTWKAIPLKADPASRLTFQVILFESSNEVQLQYHSLENGSGVTGNGRVSGSSASIGIENIDGTKGKQVAFNQEGKVASGSAFSFTLAGNAHEEGRPLGDLNGDGMLSVNDQYFLSRQYLGDLALNTSPMLSLSDLAPDPGVGGRAFGDGVIDGQDNTRLIHAVMRRLDLNPLISDVSYITAESGENLTISGSGFDTVAGNNSVRFVKADGSEIAVDAESVNIDGSELLVTVPAGTQFVSIYIEQGGLISNTSDFAIEGSPTITILTPDLEASGNTIHIRGYEFGFAPGDNQVSFNGIPATVVSADTGGAYDELIVTVPGGVSSGLVTVMTAGETSNGVMFTLDEPPVLAIETPDDKDDVVSQTDVIGTVDDVNLAAYTLEYAKVGEVFSMFGSGLDNVDDAVLGQLDPTLLLNGIYQIRLTAWDENANTSVVTRDVMVTGFNKPGVLTLSFTDLNIPVSGVPITVTRIYDSRNKTSGDFGIGWDLDLRRGEFTHNRAPGEGWYFASSRPPFPVPCQRVSETLPHITEVSLSETEYYYFSPGMTNMSSTLGGCFADALFQNIGGTHPGAELQILGNVEVFYQNGSNRVVNAHDYSLFNPTQVRLKTLDGREFDFEVDEGMTRLQDRNGNSLFISDAGVVHTSGKGIAFERDAEGRITQVTDPLGNVIVYDYDGNGDLTGVTDRESNQTQFTYDADHYLIDILNPDGTRAVRSEYDENGRLIATVDSEGNRIEQIHDLENRREVIIENGYNKIIEYDQWGNVIREVDQEGVEISTVYDADGNILSESNSLGGVTIYTYVDGHLLSQEDPHGHITSYTRDVSGKLLSVTDPLLNTIGYTYDVNGRLVATENPNGKISSTTYDVRGNKLTETDFGGNTTTYEYDNYGNRTKVVDAEGRETTSTYDANGNKHTEIRTVTTPSGPRDLVTTWTYDKNGNVLSALDPEGNIVNFEYDSQGNQTAIENTSGQRMLTGYNPAGKVASKTYPDGIGESFVYDRLSVLTSLTDRAGQTKKLTYNKADKPLSIIYPDNTPGDDSDNPRISVQYGPGGRMREMTNLGVSVEYDYDQMGRLNRVIGPMGNEIIMTHDENGNVITAKDSLGRIRGYMYDSMNRRIQTLFPDSSSTHTEYDAVGNVVSRTDQADNTTLYEYDKVNRLTAVEDAHGGRTLYGYDEVGE